MESDKSMNYFFSQLSDQKRFNNDESSNKTLSLSTKQNSFSNNSSTTTQETFQTPLSPVTFLWKDPAQTVYLTGNFCNWKQKFLMQRINNEFILILVRN